MCIELKLLIMEDIFVKWKMSRDSNYRYMRKIDIFYIWEGNIIIRQMKI